MNFQTLEAHNVDLENFSYDIQDLVDSIFVGPQGELLEMLNNFNTSYNTNLQVTKNFTLKPGGYGHIKDAYAKHVLRYDMKPRGIMSLFDRIDTYKWRERGFKTCLRTIEEKMKSLRSSGMRWQDNTQQVQDEFNKLQASIIGQLEDIRQMYPHVEVTCKMLPTNTNRLPQERYIFRSHIPYVGDTTEVTDFILLFYLKLNNATMTVHILDESSTIDTYDITMDDIRVASGTYLMPLISRHWGHEFPRTGDLDDGSRGMRNCRYFLEAIYLNSMQLSAHPYISHTTDKYTWNEGHVSNSGNVCTGNMESDIRTSLVNNEIVAHITYLITWLTNYYVPQTNPLNRIHRLRGYGDSKLFHSFRSDMNAVSGTIFQGNTNMPYDCGLGRAINSNMTNASRSTFSHSIQEELALEYSKLIEAKDLPCHNCTMQDNCIEGEYLVSIYSDSLTCEQEGLIGMMYEYDSFLHIVNQQNSRLFFSEQYVYDIRDWDGSIERYEEMIMCYNIERIWSRYSPNIVHSRLRYLWRLRPIDIRRLCIQALDPDSELFHPDATADDISQHLRLYVESDDSQDDTDVDFDWSNIPDEINESVPEEIMTPEQRAIQWAIQNGGANNL